MKRTLTLKRESLAELTATDLAAVVGANALGTLLCFTDQYRHTCLNCE